MENVINEKIYRKPVDKIIKNIENSDKQSILLAGDISSGKTVVLNELLKNKGENLYIDATVKPEEFIKYVDDEIFKLDHVCLIVKKLINFIKEKNVKEYFHFVSLDRLVSFIYENINYMYITDNYSKKKDKIDSYILKNPEVLLEEFISIISLDIKTIKLVIDNFDSIGLSSKRYQTFIYELLKKYMSFILTVSDRNVLNNHERQNSLKTNNNFIEVDYNLNVEHVKKIIELYLVNDNIRTNINFVLTDLDIAIIIEKTNGNLFDIINAVKHLYRNLNLLSREDYRLFIFNYIDKEINKNPMISGRIMPERILHIK